MFPRTRIRLLIYEIFLFEEKEGKEAVENDLCCFALVTIPLNGPKVPKSGGGKKVFHQPP